MSILQHWQQQKDALRSALKEGMPPSEVLYHTRHALLQTEQNALAEMEDHTLRQQAGILLSSLKGALGLLEAHTAGQTWIAQKASKTTGFMGKHWRIAFALLAACAVWCGFRDEWIAMALSLAGVAAALFALIREKKTHSLPVFQDEQMVTVHVDIDRMLSVLDAQMRAFDRYLDDFAYLNEQAGGASGAADPAVISRAVGLMEALYDCSEEERAPVEEAARQLLLRLGLETVDYSDDTSRLFNALPSKCVTRTLSPAILSVADKQLLRRGTAAVRIDAA